MSQTKSIPRAKGKILSRRDLSMLPLILSSDKLIVKKARSYKLNDVVVFKKRETLIAHRIIYVSPSYKYLITKGDNSPKADGKIWPGQILGKVESIKREGQTIHLSHIYLSQSSVYLKELKQINKAFSKRRIPYILLKGLPLHLYFDKTPPKRLYLDADLLIKKKDSRKATKILNEVDFKKQKSSLFGNQIKAPSQVCFVKDTKPFPTVIDLHLEPAIGFTKVKSLNSLLPSTRTYTQYLFENINPVKINNISFPIFNNHTLLIYLLLHLFHHNFQGAHRLEFISKLIKAKKIDWARVANIATKYKFKSLIFPGILILKRYYGVSLPKKYLRAMTPTCGQRLISHLIAKLVSPFNTGSRACGGIKRCIFLFLLSPKPLGSKMKILFHKHTKGYFLPAIKSFFFRTSTNSSKSRSA